MATRDDKVKISGVASDTERLLDVYVFVGSRKLYYKSNRDGADPKKATIDFDAPLRPGREPHHGRRARDARHHHAPHARRPQGRGPTARSSRRRRATTP